MLSLASALALTALVCPHPQPVRPDRYSTRMGVGLRAEELGNQLSPRFWKGI